MVQLLFGSYDPKYFCPKLMELIRDRHDTDAIKLIRSAAKDCNPSKLTDESGSTLLHYAAKEGSEDLTKCLLSLGFDANALDQHGKSPLLVAVLENRVSITEMLLDANSNMYIKAGNGQSLVQSVFDGTITCYSHIIEMFMYKVINEYTYINLQAMALIELKCPLYYVMDLRNPVITEIMLRHGCAINDREPRHGNTALHKAVYFKDRRNVKLLLAYGADVNTRDNRGKIAWRCAPNPDGSIVELKVLKMLLKRKPTLTNLTESGRMQMYKLFVRGSEAAVAMILQSGIDFSATDDKGDTVFHYLAMNSNLSGLNLLLDKSYNLNSQNRNKLSALHVAATNGNVGAMMFLLNNGAHVDAKIGGKGLTPLFCTIKATCNAHKNKCVKLLLEHGTDVQFVTSRRKTVFDMLQDPYDSVVTTLLNHLAILESNGTTIVPIIRTKIDNCKHYESQFNRFNQQLDKMKMLFEPIVDQKDEDLENKVKLQMKIKIQNKNNYSFDPYYRSIQVRPIKRAVKID